MDWPGLLFFSVLGNAKQWLSRRPGLDSRISAKFNEVAKMSEGWITVGTKRNQKWQKHIFAALLNFADGWNRTPAASVAGMHAIHFTITYGLLPIWWMKTYIDQLLDLLSGMAFELFWLRKDLFTKQRVTSAEWSKRKEFWNIVVIKFFHPSFVPIVTCFDLENSFWRFWVRNLVKNCIIFL